MRSVACLVCLWTGCSSAALNVTGDGAADASINDGSQDASGDGAIDLAGGDLVLAGDAGVDEVPCGAMSCSTMGGHVCCEAPGAYTCATEPCPSSTFFVLACDGPEDCAGRLCCYDPSMSAIRCAATCGNNDYRICHDKADCNPGECCLQLEASAPVSGCVATNGC